jgi:hypothetical protein
MSKESLEVMASLTDTPIEVRDLVDNWLLITYDIPHTEAGDKARREFLMKAMAIGASRHTDSVYLLPRSPLAEELALKLARSGEVVVWNAEPTDSAIKPEITQTYDKGLEPILDEIAGRIDRINEHMEARRIKRANKMIPKTERLLDQVGSAIERRGSGPLWAYYQVLRKRFGLL